MSATADETTAGQQPATPKSSRRRKVSVTTAIVACAVVAALFLSTAGLYYVSRVHPPASPPPFAPLEVQYSGQPCPGWSNGSVFPGIGITGGPVTMSLGLSARASSGSCTAESVSITTPGVTLVSSSAPVAVSAGASRTLTVTVRTPSTMPVENVTIVVNVGAVTAASFSH